MCVCMFIFCVGLGCGREWQVETACATCGQFDLSHTECQVGGFVIIFLGKNWVPMFLIGIVLFIVFFGGLFGQVSKGSGAQASGCLAPWIGSSWAGRGPWCWCGTKWPGVFQLDGFFGTWRCWEWGVVLMWCCQFVVYVFTSALFYAFPFGDVHRNFNLKKKTTCPSWHLQDPFEKTPYKTPQPPPFGPDSDDEVWWLH